MDIKIEYENEIPALRSATIYCPNCFKLFDALNYGVTEEGGLLHDYIDLQYGVYNCPHCHFGFTARDEELEMIEK